MTQAIGYIDSGVGGLTVVKEALKQLPHESIIFLGDSARCPYGPRPKEEVVRYTKEMVTFLLKKNVKMIVIACNTATAAALDILQKELPIPVVGVIQPGSLAALKQTNNQKIGILGTIGTIESGAYQRIIQEKNEQAQLFPLACPKFASLVESDQASSPIAKKVVSETLKPLQHKGIDTVIMGCTHYPLLREQIQRAFGAGVNLIDSGAETLTVVSTLLDYFHLAETHVSNPKPSATFYTTGSPLLFKKIAEKWLGYKELQVEKATLLPIVDEKEPMMKEILIATRNAGKAREFESFFKEQGFLIKTLLDYPDLPEIEETGKSFEENARLKSETISRLTKQIVLADDSGLMVDALNGEPGIYSARYAGEPSNDAANNAKLLAVLGETGNQNRKARFHCTLTLSAPNVESLVVEGEVEGEIAHVPRGDEGFGYDPLFYVPELNRTFGEITIEKKNKLSHRAKAIQALQDSWSNWYHNIH